MAKDHGPSIKNDKQYEGLRKKGMSKERARRSPTPRVPRSEAARTLRERCRSPGAEAQPADRIRSAAFSATMIVGALVLPETIAGITEASTTRRPSTP
jgi:hypothetical protein